WLLNFCCMTIGGYPDRVPPAYRIENEFTSTFYGKIAEDAQRKYGNLKFVDRAKELGVDGFDTGRGVAVEDFDRDGYLDIVAAGFSHGVRYYKNNGPNKPFTDVTAAVGLDGILQAHIITAADYDNDGWVDLFIGRPFGRSLLMKNDHGHFRDVTKTAGLFCDIPDDMVT